MANIAPRTNHASFESQFETWVRTRKPHSWEAQSQGRRAAGSSALHLSINKTSIWARENQRVAAAVMPRLNTSGTA